MKRRLLFLLGWCLCLIPSSAQVLVSFSVSGGRYQDTFTLSIQSEGEESSTCQIRYTLNGGTPSVESFLYEGPLTVDKNLYSKSDIYKNPNAIAQYQTPIPSDVERIVVIRAAAFNAQGEICSNIATASYVVGSLLGRDITLPILSLCVDSADLYDYQRGIFVPGASFDPARPEETGNYYLSGREHEIEGHVELIDGDVLLSQSCGVRTHGHIARRYVQKGLTLFARNEYGQKKFDPVFVHDGLKTKRLVLKPFVCAWTSMGFQDHFCQQMAKSFTSFASLKSRPVVLFLNGEYWGIYFLEEKPDEHFIQDYYGVDDKRVRIVRDWAGHDKNFQFDSSFVAMMQWLKDADLSDENQYQQLCQMVDVSSFTDYVLFETFIGNRDWPANNMRCWSADGSPWRFIFYDGDAIRSKNFQAVQNALYIGDSLTWPTSAESTLLLRKLLQNPSYRNFFVGRVYGIARMFPFKRYLQMNFKQNVAALKGEIASQSARFGSPTSVRSWRHAVRQQQRYWRHRSDRFQNEWIRSINMCYGEHFTLLPSPGYLVVSIVLVIALVIMLVIKSRLD